MPWCIYIHISILKLHSISRSNPIFQINFWVIFLWGSDPFITPKKFAQFIGLTVLTTSDLSSRFHCKINFENMHQVLKNMKNVSNYQGMVWWPELGHILLDVSGICEYFQIWTQAYKQNEIFFSTKKGHRFLRTDTPTFLYTSGHQTLQR